jgi:hypothetical protein
MTAGGVGPGRLVRPYALTGGRTRSVGEDVPFETLVVATGAGTARLAELPWEQRAIAEMCARPVAVVEIAARLEVPLVVGRVLVGDMAAAGLVEVHRPEPRGERPDLALLERVLDGLKALS